MRTCFPGWMARLPVPCDFYEDRSASRTETERHDRCLHDGVERVAQNDRSVLVRCCRLSIEARKPRPAPVSVCPDHSFASHGKPPTQLRETCSRAELSHENLSLEAVTTIADRAFQHDNYIQNVLHCGSVAAREVLSPSRHHLSGCPDAGARLLLILHRQGAAADKLFSMVTPTYAIVLWN